ncbi:DUF6644 family protein [Elongatibacter sediminis]|uniref:DUF6644 family protein n=1 Tax=Elongatibacter sediminis TaxID=3119006 RepID=A0AAW9R977_9GAMM
MDSILTWMENSAPAQFILETPWAFPTLETLHFIGLILLIGSLYVVDLRFLGLARRIPLDAVLKFVPVTVLGFVINLVTGVLFLFADPFRYYPNLAFRLKMLAVLLAGLNLLWFKFSVNLDRLAADPTATPAFTLRLIAGLSLLLWTSVIVFGRLIPYLE